MASALPRRSAPVEQLSIVPKQDPDELVAQAREQYGPIASFALVSGGKDSSVLAHRMRDHYQCGMFIDTGTAMNGVEAFVQEYMDWLGKPLLIYRAKDAFDKLVLEHGGFPGPAGHGRAYTRLKERQIEALVRDFKTGWKRTDKVMLLTGKRRAESARRSKTTKGIETRGGQLYVNPLMDWTARDMWAYRIEHKLPESPVAALLGMSGECGCGAFADDGEWEMRCQIDPAWGERIKRLQERAMEAGVRACQWGGYDACGNRITAETADGDTSVLCETCIWQQMEMEEKAA